MADSPQHIPACAWGYVRLSRDDLQGAEVTREKLEERAGMVMELAQRHGIHLPRGRVLVERESGTKMEGRPLFMQLLELAKSGQMTHLFAISQDRLARPTEAQDAQLRAALKKGGVTLITADSVVKYDRDFDRRHGLTHRVKAAVGWQYARERAWKRMDYDRDRLRRNVRSRGTAPYGYEWLRTTRDERGRLLKAGHHVPNPAEYGILEEIFRRVRSESLHSIVNDLNRRCIPPPGVTRGFPESKEWSRSTLKGIVTRPFYAGRLAQTRRVEGADDPDAEDYRVVKLDRDEWLIAEQEGDWIHPITLADHEEICSLLDARSVICVDRPQPRSALLTGILFCPNGHPMRRSAGGRKSLKTAKRGGGAMYGCDCKAIGQAHAGGHTSQGRLEEWVCDNVRAFLARKDVMDCLVELDRGNKPETAQRTRTRLNRAISDRAKAREQLSWMRDNGARHEAMFGAEAYEVAVEKATSELAAAEATLEQIQREASSPEKRDLSVLQRLSRIPIDEWWPLLEQKELEGIVLVLVARVDLLPIPPGRRYYTDAKITWAITETGIKGNLILFPRKRFAE
jgi:DNA invertase Pin-like site-specific DNA recombinase